MSGAIQVVHGHDVIRGRSWARATVPAAVSGGPERYLLRYGLDFPADARDLLLAEIAVEFPGAPIVTRP